ncbi:MAG: ATP-binding protein [Chloroflexota bacterium]|nr:ATP-binding protein [Chloroflexota bacterium]MDQ5865059.1 ATP-binding protein [Chloroflexota bacterium]
MVTNYYPISDQLPGVFDNVLARDLWLWDHLDALLLSERDLDRLDLMPDPQKGKIAGAAWIKYAQSVAVMLEGRDKSTEAQAYWLASIGLLQRHPPATPADILDATSAVIRAGVRGAGLPSRPDGDLEDILRSGLTSTQKEIQAAAVRSLLLVGTIRETIYDDAGLSEKTRELFGRVIQSWINEYMADKREPERVKGSHQQFEWAVTMFSERVGELRSLVQEIAIDATINRLNNERPRLSKQLARLQSIVFVYERPLLFRLKALLESRFDAYIKAPVENNEHVYREFERDARNLLEEVRTVGSHWAATLFAPLGLAIQKAILEHYLPIINAKYPILKVQAVKPLPSPVNGEQILEVQISNRGKGLAEECDLHIELQDSNEVTTYIESHFLGRLDPDEQRIARIPLLRIEREAPLKIKYHLEWVERESEKQQDGRLTVEQQPAIDWTELEYMVTPYRIQSIKDPKGLKGREDDLRRLRLGFQGRGSFMITGQKRVGKTSLVQVFLAELSRSTSALPIYVNIGEISAVGDNEDLGRLGHDLAERILEAYQTRFEERANVELPPVTEFRDGFNPTFTTFMRHFSVKHPLQIALVIDDFNDLPTQLFTGSTGRIFFSALRALIDSGISFFFVGSERLPSIIQEQSQRLNQVNSLILDYLDRVALVKLIREPTTDYITVSDDAIDEVALWSAGNPYFATMLCINIWVRVLERRDRWIVRHDVREVAEALASNSTRTSYEHFWSDSPKEEDDERLQYEKKSVHTILALSKTQQSPLQYVSRTKVAKNSENLRTDEIEQHLQQLLTRGILEADPERSDYIRFRVPLFAMWLKRRGAVELRDSYILGGRVGGGGGRRTELSAEEVYEAARGLSYRGQELSMDLIRVWAAQFGSIDDQRLMIKLLTGVRDKGLYTTARYHFALTELHTLIRRKAAEKGFPQVLDSRDRLENWYITHADPDGKSGSVTVRGYRSNNRLLTDHAGNALDIVPKIGFNNRPYSVLICVDDFIGSGQSATSDIKRNIIPLLEQHVLDWKKRVLLVYAAVAGYEEGIEHLNDQLSTDLIIVCRDILTVADKAFSHENDIFSTFEDRERAREIAHRIGSVLEPKMPLGWENSQALIVFPDAVPNNTLPILYKEGRNYKETPWVPLFPRS